MIPPYQPDAEAARLAPACVCQVAARVIWLRQKLHEFDRETQDRLRPFVASLPFEEQLLSSRMDAVDAAIKGIGQANLLAETPKISPKSIQCFQCQTLNNH